MYLLNSWSFKILCEKLSAIQSGIYDFQSGSGNKIIKIIKDTKYQFPKIKICNKNDKHGNYLYK